MSLWIIAVLHTAAIRKGKIAKPTEFGALITIQEAEGQIISAYAIHDGRPADTSLWIPALDRHGPIFGRAPDLARRVRGPHHVLNRRHGLRRCAYRGRDGQCLASSIKHYQASGMKH